MADEQRVITQTDPRTAPQDGQYVGRIVPDPLPEPRAWHGRHPERVIQRMDDDLGPLPPEQYVIQEGGWR